MGCEDREVPQDLAGPLRSRLGRESRRRPSGRGRARGPVPGDLCPGGGGSHGAGREPGLQGLSCAGVTTGAGSVARR